jgi:pimeloyl-ACP methyl ester carboxylesterase
MVPKAVSFDVSAALDSAQPLSQSALIFAPEDATRAKGVLVCLPGGTYDKNYWHLEVAGHPGYSFGEHLAGCGFVVVAVDHLGVGASDDFPGHAGLESMARGDAEVVRQIRASIANCSFVPDLPTDLPVVGVGHSMGACLTTMVQAMASSYDAVALLGYGIDVSNVDNTTSGVDLESSIQQNFQVLQSLSGAADGATSWTVPRTILRELFYSPDVPSAVVDADDLSLSRIPARANAEVVSPGFVSPYAAAIEVPVFLAFGEARDTSSDPHQELMNYRSATDVSLYLVPGSHHCHNMAMTRAQLWDRISRWIPSVV